MNGKFEGFVVSTFNEEIGPVPVVFDTSLDEATIVKLSLVGMMITSMGSKYSENISYRLNGPILVPGKAEYEAFSMNFFVAVSKSKDTRVEISGRLSCIWIIYKSSHREECLATHNMVEKILADEIKNIKHESEINSKENMKRVFTKIQQISTEELPTVTTEMSKLIEPVHFYTVNRQGDLIPIIRDSKKDLTDYPVLLIINTVIEIIFVLINKRDIPNRLVFLANSAARYINSQRWRGKYQICDITEPFESKILIDKATIIFNQ
ncbi:MAG: hypothetical protein ACXAEU_11650 [Candidatus Hodarchaeales archaeon]